ncbi:membrane dipeptidase [Mangrovimonas sp. TPBH4]|uniref:membrane dipeptidase n=1 Tax=Mangrovimonas sp. TPBH4 TaxID=1645914 RepID=UPI0006B5141C|nr:membrane dipeptidase [Mangrovimonas sp. TPBH4]
MSSKFQFSDLHCHPNLKTFGHSFNKGNSTKKQNVWYYNPPNFFTKLLNITLGVTKFSQVDFTTLSKGNAKIIFASLYPFEKGFFINAAGRGPFSAWLGHFVTDIGFHRIRHLQQHTDYFTDLEMEYNFLKNSQKSFKINDHEYRWSLISDQNALNKSLLNNNEIAVILSIEGAHVFNTGLSEYGKATSELEVIKNIRKIKKWEHPPFYITFAHNFNNDLCGHAESLEPIKYFVNQNKGMHSGFTKIGIKVLHELLSFQNGKPIYIDIKHMSLQSRKEYFKILEHDYSENIPPTIVSHGAVNGLSIKQKTRNSNSDYFYHSDINFFDEEIELIGKSNGLFAIQFDTRRIANPKFVKKTLNSLWREENAHLAAEVIWQQLKYIAEILDKKKLFAWGTACIGSDYDGTINPLPGIWTAEYFYSIHQELLKKASEYLKSTNPLTLNENRTITPEEISSRFFFKNTHNFLQSYY